MISGSVIPGEAIATRRQAAGGAKPPLPVRGAPTVSP